MPPSPRKTPVRKTSKNDAGRARKATRTSAFGTNGRISHDSSEYYARALQPENAAELDRAALPENELPGDAVDRIFNHTSADMHELPDRSVHLMVTSPPYNVGKEYDDDLTLADYRTLLRDVLSETYRVLVDGGRALVNVANLGRKPYIPLHAYIIEEAATAGFFMRGEIIWDKAAGAGTSTAWGSWQSPANPTLRDTHEYILVFQKPPFGRKKPKDREPTISKEDFLEWTKSVWKFGPQSAARAGHPAPFPVELPHRAIHLYTYSDEIVLDPFMGTGATAVAALKDGRRFVGYEVSSEYLALAEERLAAARAGNKWVAPKREKPGREPRSTAK